MKNTKTLATLAVMLTLGTASLANAQMQAGGYTGPTIAPTTVSEALKMRDDSAVVLIGKIEQNLGNEKYLFKDSTGSVTIEIDDEDWGGLTVGSNDTVEIMGEVDKEFTKTEIDVKRVILKK